MALPERHTADPPCQRRCTMRFPPVRPSVVSPERRHAWVLRFELERDALCVWQDLVANRLRRGPNWRASSLGVRPFRTSSTIRCRNSGAYGRMALRNRRPSFLPQRWVSTKPGQLQWHLWLHFGGLGRLSLRSIGRQSARRRDPRRLPGAHRGLPREGPVPKEHREHQTHLERPESLSISPTMLSGRGRSASSGLSAGQVRREPIACSTNQLQPRPGALRVVRWPCTAPWCSPTVQG